ncbi:hypothetical protein ACRN9G_17670 [Shewanella frigidimarina]|uniref:hypothetical protein n=1 Tax=Shewanella frigidimarina TaxID=56812 RepID=UPI003D79ADD4
MSELLEWKFDVINDSLDKLFVLVEKNEPEPMLDDLKSFVKTTGKFELDDSSYVSICDWFDVLSDETRKSFKSTMYEKSRKKIRVTHETQVALQTLKEIHKLKSVNDVILYLLDIYNEGQEIGGSRPYVHTMSESLYDRFEEPVLPL